MASNALLPILQSESADDTEPNTHASLLNLPLEIRNEIYSYFYKIPKDCSTGQYDHIYNNALLRTCQETRTEAFEYLAKVNRWVSFEIEGYSNHDYDIKGSPVLKEYIPLQLLSTSQQQILSDVSLMDIQIKGENQVPEGVQAYNAYRRGFMPYTEVRMLDFCDQFERHFLSKPTVNITLRNFCSTDFRGFEPKDLLPLARISGAFRVTFNNLEHNPLREVLVRSMTSGPKSVLEYHQLMLAVQDQWYLHFSRAQKTPTPTRLSDREMELVNFETRDHHLQIALFYSVRGNAWFRESFIARRDSDNSSEVSTLQDLGFELALAASRCELMMFYDQLHQLDYTSPQDLPVKVSWLLKDIEKAADTLESRTWRFSSPRSCTLRSILFGKFRIVEGVCLSKLEKEHSQYHNPSCRLRLAMDEYHYAFMDGPEIALASLTDDEAKIYNMDGELRNANPMLEICELCLQKGSQIISEDFYEPLKSAASNGSDRWLIPDPEMKSTKEIQRRAKRLGLVTDGEDGEGEDNENGSDENGDDDSGSSDDLRTLSLVRLLRNP